MTKMIPPDALMEQPIPLQNPLLSYLGHMPTFEDIHLTRATNSKPTEPAYYHQIFEHGIDPDVDDPSKLNDHSELPDVFLCLEDILQYREHVKARIMALYESETPYTDRCIGRALWIGIEHEGGFELTIGFSDDPNILPPPDVPKPDFAKLAKEATSGSLQNPWIESDDGPNRFFEREPYEITVPPIKAQGRPVSNGEYAKYLADVKEPQIPATWSKTRDARSDEEYTTFVARYSIKTV
ncbi:DinB-like domain [Fusarium oxysporum f. sp. vasinfectum]|nr:DinB-like domain [Fusarium oxysporum f. sp. vasinfectum]KAK2925710.1 DinB-like domain [Fusarium oxysporum f. sp. vasinfectum]